MQYPGPGHPASRDVQHRQQCRAEQHWPYSEIYQRQMQAELGPDTEVRLRMHTSPALWVRAPSLGDGWLKVPAYGSTMCGDELPGGLATPEDYGRFAQTLVERAAIRSSSSSACCSLTSASRVASTPCKS